MSKWYNSLAGSASFVQLRPRTKSGLRNSILLTVLCTLTISMDLSGFSATSAKKHIMSTVSAPIKTNQPSAPFYAPSMNVRSGENFKRVMHFHLKRVIKRVIFPVLVVKEKQTKKLFKRGKDGRKIAPRHPASSGKGRKEQAWSEEDINRAFAMWEANAEKKPEERLSKRQIAIDCKIPYTTFCERVSGRQGGGRKGKIAGGKQDGKILDKGKQAGSSSG